jgi:hemolysin D
MMKRSLPTPANLFRSAQNALEQGVHSSHEGVVLQQSRFWARAITWTLMGTTGFALAWLALAKTEEIVVAPGKLEPVGQVKPIQVPVGGVVEEILVKEGAEVKKGQILLRLDTEATIDRQKSLVETISLKEQQLEAKNNELQRYLQLNTTEQKVLQKNLALQREILARLEGLARQGASAELQYLQQRNEVQEVEGKLDQPSWRRPSSSCVASWPISRASSPNCG